jgi:hypothetical protein
MFVRIGFKGLEEGGRGVDEEHALPPACWHRGRDGEKGWEGEKGVGGKKVAVCVLGGSVRTRFCWCRPIPFPSGQLDPGARHASTPTTLNLSLRTHNSRILYLLDYRPKRPFDPLAMRSTNRSSNHEGQGSHPSTTSSAGTFGFGGRRKLGHRALKVGGLVIEHSLNDGVATWRGSVRSLEGEHWSYIVTSV